ncbi:MAG: hypothetical protein ACYDBJ_21595 [Aggregatilineales bacterium]
MTSILLGLLAAVFYGASDFSGGLATRRTNVFGVVMVSQCFGLLTVAVVVLSNGDPLPPAVDLVWGALAGLAGVAGLVAFYRALSIGQIGMATPITAVLAAGLPVAVAAFTQDCPVRYRCLVSDWDCSACGFSPELRCASNKLVFALNSTCRFSPGYAWVVF